MLHPEAPSEHSLIGPEEGPVVEILNGSGCAPLVLVCEHASNFIPASLGGLGLGAEAARSHAAWDPGAMDVARRLAHALDAPLVASRVSRLVYDCNRPPEAPGAMPPQVEIYDVPGNHDLDDVSRQARFDAVYVPFRDAVASVFDAKPAQTALITVHSFTPVYNRVRRETELGLLHDSDARLAEAMLAAAPSHTGLRSELNQPYSARDGVMHTLKAHAIPRGAPNVMLELRNDLLQTPEAIAAIAADLGRLIDAGLAACQSSSTGETA